jgi:DNA modification methylase
MRILNTIRPCDCVEGMKQLPEGSIDCCVTDPPNGIKFMGNHWEYAIPSVEVWKEVLRVLKPGAHMLVACGARVQHRMAVNIEDAAFEIRDVICRHYGSGFPKSMEPATEFWTMARKQIAEKTIAENVLKFGAGGLNIDACRISWPGNVPPNIGTPGWGGPNKKFTIAPGTEGPTIQRTEANVLGRFPANLILDAFMASEMDAQSGLLTSGKPVGKRKAKNKIYGPYGTGQDITGFGDSGGASRFFYVAKADVKERIPGNTHPTVKPLALMQYLIRLICPVEPGRVVLEPFAGSGTICIAARQLGLDFIGFEKDGESFRIGERRLKEELGLFHDA